MPYGVKAPLPGWVVGSLHLLIVLPISPPSPLSVAHGLDTDPTLPMTLCHLHPHILAPVQRKPVPPTPCSGSLPHSFLHLLTTPSLPAPCLPFA